MTDLDPEEKALLTRNIAWLEQAGPDDWHRAALDFDWGEPLYLLDWIVRQPACDIATALTIFWQGEPACWIEESNQGSDREQPNGFSWLNKQMCAYISHRILAGGYSRSQIAFKPDPFRKAAYVELAALEKGLTNPSFGVTELFIIDRIGQIVENDHIFYRRYPEDFHFSVLIDLPEDTPQAITAEATVKSLTEKMRQHLPAWLR